MQVREYWFLSTSHLLPHRFLKYIKHGVRIKTNTEPVSIFALICIYTQSDQKSYGEKIRGLHISSHYIGLLAKLLLRY